MRAKKSKTEAAAGKPDPQASAERLLDAAVEMTFPASDPISVEHAFKAASERDEDDAR
jgi:hypothetical protein